MTSLEQEVQINIWSKRNKRLYSMGGPLSPSKSVTGFYITGCGRLVARGSTGS